MDVTFWHGLLVGFAAGFLASVFCIFMFLRKILKRQASWLRSKNEGW